MHIVSIEPVASKPQCLGLPGVYQDEVSTDIIANHYHCLSGFKCEGAAGGGGGGEATAATSLDIRLG